MGYLKDSRPKHSEPHIKGGGTGGWKTGGGTGGWRGGGTGGWQLV